MAITIVDDPIVWLMTLGETDFGHRLKTANDYTWLSLRKQSSWIGQTISSQRFNSMSSDVFRGYRNWNLKWNELKMICTKRY